MIQIERSRNVKRPSTALPLKQKKPKRKKALPGATRHGRLIYDGKEDGDGAGKAPIYCIILEM